jgi:hypothetical protein
MLSTSLLRLEDPINAMMRMRGGERERGRKDYINNGNKD